MLNNIAALHPAAAALNSYESIQTVTVGAGGASSISFTLIPSTFKHLQIRGLARTNGALWFQTNINGDTSTNYASHALYANGATVSTLGIGTGVPYGYTALIEGDGQSVMVMDILDYASTDKNKTIRNLWGNDRNGAGNIGMNSFFRPAQTGAITTVTITAALLQYSSFALYGIKG
jgi:hypothetical protein